MSTQLHDVVAVGPDGDVRFFAKSVEQPVAAKVLDAAFTLRSVADEHDGAIYHVAPVGTYAYPSAQAEGATKGGVR